MDGYRQQEERIMKEVSQEVRRRKEIRRGLWLLTPVVPTILGAGYAMDRGPGVAMTGAIPMAAFFVVIACIVGAFVFLKGDCW